MVGAGGFIGRHVAAALERAGHQVVRATRSSIDLARDHDPQRWREHLREHLRGIDVAINAAGLFREGGARTFEAIHVRGPVALFEACAREGVRVIQVSALGADEGAASEFQRSKMRADDALVALGVPCVVLQPSLVYGDDGASARLFATLASLPLIPLPGAGEQRVQPVHVDDVAEAVVAIVRDGVLDRRRIPLVGREPLSLRAFLAMLRAALGLGRARFVKVPEPLVTLAATLRVGLFDRDAWRMLRRGNIADAQPMRALLHREPRAVGEFVEPAHRSAARTAAQLGWLLPLLRLALAIVWIVAGVVSAFLYPEDASLALLARTGLTGTAAYAALYGASLLDFALGVATWALPRRRLLWLVQIAVVVAYTAIVTVALPEQWLHPYGPVVKNLPILAALVLLYTLERE